MRLLFVPLRNIREIGTVVVLGGVYFVAAKLGLRLAYFHPSATPVWPPTGIALASLLLIGYRAWPGIFLGAILANLTTEGTVWTSLGIATGNTLEGLIGAYFVNTYANGRNAFHRPQDTFKFAFFAAVASTTISATIGVTSLALGGFAPWGDYRPIWFTWWLGDAAGALIVAPLLVLYATNPKFRWHGQAALERALFLLTLLAVSWIVFRGIFPFAYLTVPLLVWAAFRFDQRETALVIAFLAGVAIWGTVDGRGPFVGATRNESLLLLQAFMGIMAIAALPLGGVVETLRRKLAEDELISAVVAKTAGETDIGRMLTVALEELQRAISFTGGSFALVEGEELVIRSAIGPYAETARGQRLPRGQGRVWQIVSTQMPFLSNDVVREGLRPTTPIRSYLGVPLSWQGRTFGVLEVDSSEVNAFQATDLDLLQRVAATISGSIELARRFAAEVAAKAEAESSREERGRLYEHVSSLQRVTAILSRAVTPEQVIEVIVEQGTRALGAQAGAFYQVTGEGDALELFRAINYPEEMTGPWRQHPTSIATWATDAVRNRDPVFLESGDELLQRYPHFANVKRPFPEAARAAVPLIIGARVVGVLVLNFARPRRFESYDKELILGVARPCAQALERARLYEREHNVAETLQRALLPAELPQLPGIDIHAIYVPGTREAEVGGDWYDVFRLPDGHIAFSVGDVAGRGLGAAVIMGQLRQAIRAAALEGHGPVMVLNQANKILQLTSPLGGMATGIFGVLDPVKLIFAYAVAGHPAPVLATLDGRVEALEAGGGLPLGISAWRLPSPRTVSLSHGSLLVLHTDGLIEVTRNAKQGEAALLSALGAELEQRSTDPAQAILNRVLNGRRAEDDIAMVVLSIARAPLRRLNVALPAVPISARDVRQAFHRLADALGLDKGRATMFEVALGEAVNNVVEHAYGATRGTLDVRVWHEGDTLIAEIEDHGRWRKERGEERGYGLQIMRATVECMHVESGPSGTIVRLTLSGAAFPVPLQADQSVPPAGPPQGTTGEPQKAGGREDPYADVTSTMGGGPIQIEHVAGVPVVKVTGDVDVTNAREFETTLEHAGRTDKRAVVVDLAGTTFLDSKAMHVLFRFAERLVKNRQRLIIVIPRDRDLRRVLEIVGVTQALSVFDSLDRALAEGVRGKATKP